MARGNGHVGNPRRSHVGDRHMFRYSPPLVDQRSWTRRNRISSRKSTKHQNNIYLLGGLEHFYFPMYIYIYILGIIITFDFRIFQRGRYTTNQI